MGRYKKGDCKESRPDMENENCDEILSGSIGLSIRDFKSIISRMEEAAIMIIDDEVRQLNDRLAEYLGFDPECMDFERLKKRIHPDDREKTMDKYYRRKNGGGSSEEYDIRMIHSDGSVRWMRIVPISVQKGDNTLVLLMARNITDNYMVRTKFFAEKERSKYVLDLLSHDIANIQQGITGWTEIARDHDDPGVRRMSMEEVGKLNSRTSEIIKHVKILSRVYDNRMLVQPLDIMRIIRDTAGRVFKDDDEITYPDETRSFYIMAEPILSEAFGYIFRNMNRRIDDEGSLEIIPDVENCSEGHLSVRIIVRGYDEAEKLMRILKMDVSFVPFELRRSIDLFTTRMLIERYNGKLEFISLTDGVNGEEKMEIRVSFPLFSK